MINSLPEWLNGDWNHDDILVSSEIKMSRNISGFNFSSACSSHDKKRISDIVKKEFIPDLEMKPVESMCLSFRKMLMERRLLSESASNGKKFTEVYWSDDQNESICLNDEDHIRIRLIGNGSCMPEMILKMYARESDLAASLQLSKMDGYGYLTSHYRNSGSGVRLSILLHTPAICLSNYSEAIGVKIAASNISIGGTFADDTVGYGNIFHLYCDPSSSRDIMSNAEDLMSIANEIADIERDLRSRELDDETINTISLSWGILKYSNVLYFSEALNSISCSILGMKTGLGSFDSNMLKEMMLGMMDGHLLNCIDNGDAPICLEKARAEYLRERIGNKKLVLD